MSRRGLIDLAGSAVTNSAAYTNFIARTSGTSGTEQAAYAAMLNGLTTDGLFNSDGSSSYLDFLYIFATNTTTTALLNLVSSSYSGTAHGTPTFSADHGYTGNGSSMYIDTNWNPNSGGNHYGKNSGSFGVYETSAGGNDSPIGNKGLNYFEMMYLFPSYAGTCYASINTGTSNDMSNTVATAAGLTIVSRTASNASAVYKNGNATAIATSTTVATAALDSVNCYILARNDATGGSNWYSTAQVSAAFAGGGLTSTLMNKLATRINGYMTALGINVY